MKIEVSKCSISPDECISCGVCIDACPQNAITGTLGGGGDVTLYIDQTKCNCCIGQNTPICCQICPVEDVIDCHHCGEYDC
jgi:Fe-S-cluster-containing hydrogenase component 2